MVRALVETAVFPVDQWQSSADGNISQRTPVCSKHTNTRLAPCLQNTRLPSGTVRLPLAAALARSLESNAHCACPFTMLIALPCFNDERTL